MTTPQVRYSLRVNLAVTKEIKYGEHESYWQSTPERLDISESIDLGSLDFLGVMKVLGQMHEAVTEIKP